MCDFKRSYPARLEHRDRQELAGTTAFFVAGTQAPLSLLRPYAHPSPRPVSRFLLQYFLSAIPTDRMCARECFPSRKPKPDPSSTSALLFCRPACCFCFCCQLFEYFTRLHRGTVGTQWEKAVGKVGSHFHTRNKFIPGTSR